MELPTVATTPSRPSRRPPIPPARTPLRILLVEDHKHTLALMTKLLQSLGHDVLAAANVKEALALAEREELDLVISDLGLPDGSGHDVMRSLKSRYALKGIAVSGYGMDEDINRSLDSGFVKHLIKPVDLERLKLAIQQAGAATSQ
jgi:CheY-like chemotaxis protein